MTNVRIINTPFGLNSYQPTGSYYYMLGGASPENYYAFTLTCAEPIDYAITLMGWDPSSGPWIQIEVKETQATVITVTVLEVSPANPAAARKANLTLVPKAKP